MKKSKKLISFLMVTAVAAAAFAFASCEPTEDDTGKTNDPVLEFVAADKTNWDKEITLAQKTYTMSLKLNADKTLALVATCTGESASGGGQGGGGGSGESAAYKVKENAEGEGVGENPDGGEENTDYTMYDFTINGSWTEEKGWGYTLNFNDSSKTTIVADFDTTMGRHYFYYYMSPVIAGTQASETQVQFQAKDSQYRKTLDSNYVINAERTSTYMFHGGGFDAQTGNKAEVKIYLLKNGGIAVYAESGSELTFTGKGSWSEDTTNHVITLDVNGSKMTTNAYCSTVGKEGYRMVYSTGRTSLEAFCPVASGVTWDMYEDTDFDGKAVLELQGGDYTLMLTDKNFAILRRGSTKVSTLSYEVDANGNYVIKDGKITVIKESFFNPEIEKSDATSSKNGNVITVIVTVGISNGPGINYSDITFTGTVS